jgi:hypothetical protein
MARDMVAFTVLVAALRNLCDCDDEYDSIPDTMKMRYWMIPNPTVHLMGLDVGPRWIPIPKPHEPGYIVASGVDSLLIWARRQDPETFKEWVRVVTEMIPGYGWDFVPTGIQGAWQAMRNVKDWSGMTIEPEWMKKGREPEARVFESTTHTARHIADVTSHIPLPKGFDMIKSPIQIDHLIQSQFPGVFSGMLDITELIFQKAGAPGFGEERRGLTWGSTIPGRIFQYDLPFNTEPVRRLYKRYEDGVKGVGTEAYWAGQMTEPGATDYQRKKARRKIKSNRETHGRDMDMLSAYKKALDVIGDAREMYYQASTESQRQKARAMGDMEARGVIGYGAAGSLYEAYRDSK